MALSLTSHTASARQALAVDAQALAGLKAQASGDDPKARQAALAEAAKQLESLFMRELLKSMREATKQAGLDASDQGSLATDLFDQQMSVQMAGQPAGLAEAIQRQLARQLGGSSTPGLVPGATFGLDALRRPQAARADDPHARAPRGREDFVAHHRAAAERVARDSGIPAAFMLGQAGHETGWGAGQIRTQGGGNSFNLFGIKAGRGWSGKTAEVTTTEYIDGQPRKLVAKFRAYDSFEESFRDYARLINDNPRYEKARGQTHSAHAYAAELQKAGYATDPQYAAKLGRAIQSTLALARPPAGPALAQAARGTQA